MQNLFLTQIFPAEQNTTIIIMPTLKNEPFLKEGTILTLVFLVTVLSLGIIKHKEFVLKNMRGLRQKNSACPLSCLLFSLFKIVAEAVQIIALWVGKTSCPGDPHGVC